MLISQLASHPMCEISTIHQHISFNSNSRSRRSLWLSYSRRYATPCVRFLSSFVIRLSNPNVFLLLPGNSLITLRSPWSIIRYKNLNKCFIFFGKNHFRGFLIKLLEFTKKNCRVIITNNIENWYSNCKRSVNKQVLFLNAAAVCNTSEFWRVYLSARLPQRSGTRYFLTSIFHKVV